MATTTHYKNTFQRQIEKEKRAERAQAKMLEIAKQHSHAVLRNSFKKVAQVNPSTDRLMVAITKLGGFNRWSAYQEGFDPAEFNIRGWRIHCLFTNEGDSADGLAERLSQYGYPVHEGYARDGSPIYTVSAFLTALHQDLFDYHNHGFSPVMGNQTENEYYQKYDSAHRESYDAASVEFVDTDSTDGSEFVDTTEQDVAFYGFDEATECSVLHDDTVVVVEIPLADQDFSLRVVTKKDLATADAKKKFAEAEEAQAIARATVESPQSFVLSGSERKTDLLTAHGVAGLFDNPAVPAPVPTVPAPVPPVPVPQAAPIASDTKDFPIRAVGNGSFAPYFQLAEPIDVATLALNYTILGTEYFTKADANGNVVERYVTAHVHPSGLMTLVWIKAPDPGSFITVRYVANGVVKALVVPIPAPVPAPAPAPAPDAVAEATTVPTIVPAAFLFFMGVLLLLPIVLTHWVAVIKVIGLAVMAVVAYFAIAPETQAVKEEELSSNQER